MMGVCFDCLVVIDGRQNQQGVPRAGGRRHGDRDAAGSTPSAHEGTRVSRRYDLVVVGAGPAGLAAAAHGVAVRDEHPAARRAARGRRPDLPQRHVVAVHAPAGAGRRLSARRGVDRGVPPFCRDACAGGFGIRVDEDRGRRLRDRLDRGGRRRAPHGNRDRRGGDPRDRRAGASVCHTRLDHSGRHDRRRRAVAAQDLRHRAFGAPGPGRHGPVAVAARVAVPAGGSGDRRAARHHAQGTLRRGGDARPRVSSPRTISPGASGCCAKCARA